MIRFFGGGLIGAALVVLIVITLLPTAGPLIGEALGAGLTLAGLMLGGLWDLRRLDG